MKSISFLGVGVFFGVVMFMSGASSWFRIYEMFQFKSFHMYGIIGSALVTGMLLVWVIKKFRVKDTAGKPIVFCPKDKSFARYMLGGVIFGLGWALVGACPGPMFTLLGAGYYSMFIVIAGAVFGTWLYGLIKNKLPH